MTALPPPTDWWRASPTVADDPATASALAGPPTRPASVVPFWAILGFTVILFLSPQSFWPSLASMRIALIAATLGIGAHLLDRFTHHQPITILPRELQIAFALGAWALLIVPLSIWPGGSLSFLESVYFKTLAIFWLLINVVTTPERLVAVAWALSLIAAPVAITAVHHWVTGVIIPMNLDIKRIVGYDAPLTKNPNDLALVLNMLLPLTVALALMERRVLARGVLLASTVLGVVGVIVTFSRAGSLALGTVFVAYLVKLRGRPERRVAWVLLILALCATPLLPSRYFERLETITDIKSDSTGSAQERVRDMLAAATYILRHPLIGAGAGMDRLALNQVRGAKWLVVHDTYLEYAVDLGLPGLAMFLLLLVGSLKCTTFVQRQAAEAPAFRGLFHLAEGLQISLVAFAVAAVFEPGGYNLGFYYIAGLAIALKNVYQHEARRAAVEIR
jgi:putative inorganic carbon (HCO3(-)) transporter